MFLASHIKNNKGITLISLVITIILLIVLAGIAINLSLGNNGLFNKTKEAKELTNKQEATEKINLKITTAQVNKYAEKQEMPTLKELSIVLGNDDEIAYVTEVSQIAGTKYDVGDSPTSIFTKLKNYKYEFEINSSLQLASINGIKVAKEETVTIPKEEYEGLKNTINQIRAGQITIGTIGKSSGKSVNVTFSEPMQNNNYSVVVTHINPVYAYAQTQYVITNKTINGFTITAYNTNGSNSTGSIVANYIVIPYTE